MNRELANLIYDNLKEISKVFSDYQSNVNLPCPPGCGKCCFNAEVSCSPYELLPLAYHLMDSGIAEEVLEKASLPTSGICLFLDVKESSLGLGSCGQYEHRPFICRAFGLTARKGKNGRIDRTFCKVLNQELLSSSHLQIIDDEIPLIDVWKKRLESIDPHLLEKEVPIHQAIVIILEKILLIKKYSEQ